MVTKYHFLENNANLRVWIRMQLKKEIDLIVLSARAEMSSFFVYHCCDFIINLSLWLWVNQLLLKNMSKFQNLMICIYVHIKVRFFFTATFIVVNVPVYVIFKIWISVASFMPQNLCFDIHRATSVLKTKQVTTWLTCELESKQP